MTNPLMTPRPSVVADFKRLAARAAAIGAVLAVLCHLLPPQYRVACDHIAQICKGNL